MKSERVKVAAVLPLHDEYAIRILNGATQYVRDHPHVVLIDRFFDRSGRLPARQAVAGFNGALVCLSPDDTWVNGLLAAGLAIVNTTGDSPTAGVPNVAFDGETVVQEAIDHIVELRVKNVAYLGSVTETSQALKHRRSLFLRLAERHGMKGYAFDMNWQSSFSEPTVSHKSRHWKRLRQFLADLPRPAAVWCEDDLLGTIVLDVAREEEWRVPEELAVLGLADYRIACCCQPPLSSIPQPGEMIGYEAMRLLDAHLHGRRTATKHLRLPSPPLVRRESTGGGALTDRRFARAHRVIAERACEGFTVAEVMNLTQLSQHTFSKRFAEAYGRTPGAEIRHVRVEQAKSYLRTTLLQVGRIAELCGYSSHSKFTNFFRRATGLSPREYRKGHEGNH